MTKTDAANQTFQSPSARTVLVTGATSGIGKELAMKLLELGYQVIIHGRNPKKIEQALAEAARRAPGARAEAILADFSSLDEVKSMAEEAKKRFSHLDLLVNNAGLYSKWRRSSADGYELSFAVNYLASFVNTLRLLPLLAQSSAARIINISSIGHRYVWINPRDLNSQHFFWSWVNYCRSKLLQIPFTIRLAEFLKGSKITVNAIHPGVIMGTEVTNTAFVKWGLPLETGAANVVRLVTDPALENVSGKYFQGQKISKPSPAALNTRLKIRLWEKSFEWAGLNRQQTEDFLKTLSQNGQRCNPQCVCP